MNEKGKFVISGGFKISQRGVQPIQPNLPENCMKMRKIFPVGGVQNLSM